MPTPSSCTLQPRLRVAARDRTQPGSFFQRPKEAAKREPGNEVGIQLALTRYFDPRQSNGDTRKLIIARYYPAIHTKRVQISHMHLRRSRCLNIELFISR